MGQQDTATLAGTVTQLIGQIEAGNQAAQAELCELVYNELRAIGRRLHRHRGGDSWATTDLVHEFLCGFLSAGTRHTDQPGAGSRFGQMKNRRYFYAAAADQMRRLLIDHWRHKCTQAQGGNRRRENLEPWLDELVDSTASRCGGDLEAFEAALARLQKDRPRQYEVAQLKLVVGLTNKQIAETLDISVDTVKRDWKIARARLGACLTDDS